jgi:hypothetical protein
MHDFTWVRTGIRYRGIPYGNPGGVSENVIHIHRMHFELLSNGTVIEIPASVAKSISLDERLSRFFKELPEHSPAFLLRFRNEVSQFRDPEVICACRKALDRVSLQVLFPFIAGWYDGATSGYASHGQQNRNTALA